jgi:RHH-type rel operon transcriptional repressor/antitoxin RelB
MTVSIRLDPEIEQRLDDLVTKTGCSKSYFLRKLIESGLDNMEDFYLADATIKRLRNGQESVVIGSEARSFVLND